MDKNLNFNDIKDKMKYSSKMSNISCFLDVERFGWLLNKLSLKEKS